MKLIIFLVLLAIAANWFGPSYSLELQSAKGPDPADLQIHHACNAEAAGRVMHPSEAARCAAAFTRIKLAFVPGISGTAFDRLSPSERAGVNALGYERYRDWLLPMEAARVWVAQAGVPASTDRLQRRIIDWLTAGFDLPGSPDLPAVVFADEGEMVAVRASALDRAEDQERLHATIGNGFGFVALYDDRTRTIYLEKGWSAASPKDVSVLVHEMVHHLQNVNGLTYPCEEGREHPAYEAQERWLENAGTSLEGAFGIDAMTLLVSTRCWFGPP